MFVCHTGVFSGDYSIPIVQKGVQKVVQKGGFNGQKVVKDYVLGT